MTLKVELAKKQVGESTADVLAVGVYQSALAKQKALTLLDELVGGTLLPHAAAAEFSGAREQCLDVATLGALPFKRILLIGLGPKSARDVAVWRTFGAMAARLCNAESLGLLPPDGANPSLRILAEGVRLGAYRFTKYLTGERVPKVELSRVAIHGTRAPKKPTAKDKREIETGLAVADAVCVARDAVNEPPNVLVPETLAHAARGVARRGKLKISVLDMAGIKKAGMHLHYAVGQGSRNEPRFIHMQYTPKRPKKKLVFVGKGLTFDSGGLCIKPAPGMGDMKSDMGGAAAVLGLMAAVAALKPNVEVHGIIGAAENMPDGNAYRPGDVFGSLDGKTVEIINTDAEGRLVLADALTYARNLEPDLIVDAATLTGACMVALGKNCSAFYSESEVWAKRFGKAADSTGEQFWRMPLLAEMLEQLKSDVADLKHTGERWGGSISAAMFLRQFVGKVPYIHCDVAGPVLSDRPRGFYPKGGTGHPVLTFVDFVERLG